MDINKFIKLRENLYHLTDEKNLENILEKRKLFSTAQLVKIASVTEMDTFLRTRRVGHHQISSGDFTVILRDQDPLFRKIVEKNLVDGWTFEDFVYSLNSRVFFWATEKDLKNHYQRYENQGEFPKVLKFKTLDIISVNLNPPQFCRLNSGAPRCSSYYTEGAPPRGLETFLEAANYLGTPSSVREVTFMNQCILPDHMWIAGHPESQYKKV